MRNGQLPRLSARPLAALLLGLILTGGLTAAPLLPPSLSIRMPQNAVIVGTVLEVIDDEHVRFRRDQVLQEDRALQESGGAPPEEVVVSMDNELAATLEPGGRYVLAYTSLEKEAKGENTYSIDPQGPRLVILPAVGPALLEDSPALRKLATPRPSDAELAPRERLDLILAQVERPDPASRLFVLAELVLWTELHGALTDQDLARFRTVLESGELEPQAREYYLRAFLPIHEQVGDDWLLAECRRVLAENEPEMDLLTPYPSLVRMALNSLREIGTAEDGEAALEFLQSNNEAVSLAAFRAGVELAPDLTEDVVEKIVLIGNLPLDTEREAIHFLAERQAARREEGAPR